MTRRDDREYRAIVERGATPPAATHRSSHAAGLPPRTARRQWRASLILAGFLVAVAGAALAGWWYARESSPHLGPIVLVSVDGWTHGALRAPDASDPATPAIDALAADAVVFERAYTHSPLTLPAHASLLAGQLPFEHGVRDNAGFTLAESARPLAELLRSRGFETGATVSSFVLRRESGLARGFSYFDSEIPDAANGEPPPLERGGDETAAMANAWIRSRGGHRFFLFVQVPGASADSAVASVVAELRARGLYEQATIVLTADGGAADSDPSLDEASLRVPLLVKQPDEEGAGRLISLPVQHIDLVPTLLDLVRAPVPSGLRGRSLRALLGGDDEGLGDQDIYSESLTALFRFGGTPSFALAGPTHRYVRGVTDEVIALAGADPAATPAAEAEANRLRTRLDALLEGRTLGTPTPIAESDERRFAALGYLGGPPLIPAAPAALEPVSAIWVAQIHRVAAVLIAGRQYGAAINRLREITGAHPSLAIVRYQTGLWLSRSGRLTEAVAALRATATLEPDSPYVQIAVADTWLRAGRQEEAAGSAALAVALSDHLDTRAQAAAHAVAAAAALARGDADGATSHAAEAQRADPALPMITFVAGRLHHAEGRYNEALTAFETTARALAQSGRALEGVHWYRGETLARLERSDDAEAAFREELRAFPHSLTGHVSLATLYQASGRQAQMASALDALIAAIPTPEGYDAAAGLWVVAGDRARGAALRADAKVRFRGDPSLSPIERGGRR